MQTSPKLLVFGQIWPEAQASAASTRLLDLLESFETRAYSITITSDGVENAATEQLRQKGYNCHRWAPNDSRIDAYLSELNPAITLFDRFNSEEKFGWRVRASCPDSLRILDTIDLHCLRLGREKALHLQKTSSAFPHLASAILNVEDALRYAGDLSEREVASIFRSDLSLLVSDVEVRLLQEHCAVPPSLLHLCRLTYGPIQEIAPYESRYGYVLIGNFKHPPNVDAILYLRDEIWPRIRRLQADAVIHVWGAHAKPQHIEWQRPQDGFFIKGYAPDQFAAIKAARVCLAPLRYGAGIKGKIADAWWTGTPVVSTSSGAEGMHDDLAFAGCVTDDPAGFAEAAVALHQTSSLWQDASQQAQTIIQTLYSQATTLDVLHQRIEQVAAAKEILRRQNFIGSMLWQQGLRSSEYFSRWIEVKNQLALIRSQEKLADSLPINER